MSSSRFETGTLARELHDYRAATSRPAGAFLPCLFMNKHLGDSTLM